MGLHKNWRRGGSLTGRRYGMSLCRHCRKFVPRNVLPQHERKCVHIPFHPEGLRVWCPTCKVGRGEPCRNPEGDFGPVYLHAERAKLGEQS